jgi:hypothetical protein
LWTPQRPPCGAGHGHRTRHGRFGSNCQPGRVLLYDRPFLTSPPREAPENSSTLPLPSGFWPDFRWFGWNDRARGARIFGTTVLCEHIWFDGRRAWLFGFNGLIPLRPLFFDQTASSAIVF